MTIPTKEQEKLKSLALLAIGMLISRIVRSNGTFHQLRSLGKRAVVCLMLLLWVATTLTAASPTLHELIHADAKSEQHQCAATDVLHGKVFHNVPVAIAPEPVQFASVEPAPFVSVLLPAIPYRLAPGRAPPIVCAVS